jgi:hypothetical protein
MSALLLLQVGTFDRDIIFLVKNISVYGGSKICEGVVIKSLPYSANLKAENFLDFVEFLSELVFHIEGNISILRDHARSLRTILIQLIHGGNIEMSRDSVFLSLLVFLDRLSPEWTVDSLMTRNDSFLEESPHFSAILTSVICSETKLLFEEYNCLLGDLLFSTNRDEYVITNLNTRISRVQMMSRVCFSIFDAILIMLIGLPTLTDAESTSNSTWSDAIPPKLMLFVKSVSLVNLFTCYILLYICNRR